MPARARIVGVAVLVLLLGGIAPVLAAEANDPLARAGELYERGDFEAAADLYRRAARSGKQAAIAWFNHGNCLARLGRRGEAANSWAKAIEWAPGFRRARLNLAILAEEDGDLAMAAVQYRRLWEMDRQDPSPPLRLGEIQARQGDPVGAQLWFDRALAADSASIDAWRGIVRATLATGDTLSAVELLDRWERSISDTTGRAWFQLSALREGVGSLEGARRATERGLSMAPSRPDGWLRLARLCQLQGNDATAVAVLRQAVVNVPDESRLWRSLGQAGLRAGDPQAAWEGLEGSVERGDSGALLYIRLLAEWHDRRGEGALAARARSLAKSIRQKPSSPSAVAPPDSSGTAAGLP
ncbi:MAG: tetratricopeptide repeat protein [Fibrobacteria bacterium]|nr:tetratricopeptide repeat protein [Fibrobacteria bacterium]